MIKALFVLKTILSGKFIAVVHCDFVGEKRDFNQSLLSVDSIINCSVWVGKFFGCIQV
jgi:hypothetical protein